MDTLFKIWTIFVIGFCALYIVAQPIHTWMKYDLENGTPRVDFYTPEAYANCGAMMDEAKRRGATHWTCHKPEIAD